MKGLKALRDRRADVISEGETILGAIAGDMTDDVRETLRDLKIEQDGLDTKIAKAEEDAEFASAFKTDGDGIVSGGSPRILEDPKGGFVNLGEFAMAVRAAASPHNRHVDPRLAIGAAPTSMANEGSGSDGGFLIPPAFSNTIYQHSLEGDAMLPMTDNINVEGNSMTFPRDETTPWGSSGVTAYWESEAAQATQTKPVIGTDTLRLRKLFALVPMTDELMSDASALSSYVERKASESIRYKVNDSLVNGTGAGKPMGIANAAALVSQAKEAGQAADTIVAANVAKMYARNLNPGGAVWMINSDAFNQIVVMTIGDQPVYSGPTITGTPGGSLLGRPVIMSETCKTLGDKGDIYFVDWKGYVSITKAAGIEASTSIHLWFDYDVTAFRAIFRVDGQPWHTAAVTPPNSAVTKSSMITLAARA
jgi:HK97 family phage major capsid protein